MDTDQSNHKNVGLVKQFVVPGREGDDQHGWTKLCTIISYCAVRSLHYMLREQFFWLPRRQVAISLEQSTVKAR